MLGAFMLWRGIVRRVEVAFLMCVRVDTVVLLVRIGAIVFVIMTVGICYVLDRILRMSV